MWYGAKANVLSCAMLVSVAFNANRADDDMHSYAGFLPTTNCWDEKQNLTHDVCCYGAGAERCFGNWPAAYEPCCLFQNTLRKGGHLAFDAYIMGSEEPWPPEGGDVDLDGLLFHVAHSAEAGPLGTLFYRQMLQSGCCQAAIARSLQLATERATWSLIGVVAKQLLELQAMDIPINGYLTTSAPGTSLLDLVRSSVAETLGQEPLNDTVGPSFLEDRCAKAGLPRCGWPNLGDEILPLHVQQLHAHLTKLMDALDQNNNRGVGGTFGGLPAVNPVLQCIKQLNEANAHLAVRVATMPLVHTKSWLGVYPLDLGPRFHWEQRFCCRFVDIVEGVTRDVFLSGRPRVVRVVELGVNLGAVGLHLLSRYAWLSYVGIDSLQGSDLDHPLMEDELRARFSTYSSRARLMVPTNTTTAAKMLRREGLVFDVLVLDARFDHQGLNADVATWLPLLPAGGYAIARSSIQRHMGALWQRHMLPSDVYLCTSVDGFAFYHRVRVP